MNTTDFDMERILAPIQADAFLRDVWEREPLAIHRKRRDHYAGLFSLNDVDSVIAFTRPRFTETATFVGGPPETRCVQGWLPDQEQAPGDLYPGIAEVRRVYAEGKTVVIRGMQHRWPAIASLCRSLEGVFHCPVHGNLYLTPPKSQGFDTHFDAHEVFALQLDGVKHWRLYGPAAVLPLAGEKANVPRAQLGKREEVRLEAGDLLYIPRGHAHDAFTSERNSLHLTIGINVFRWADLLRSALDDLSRRDARFRETLPAEVVCDDGESPTNEKRFQELLSCLADQASFGAAACRLGTEFWNGLPMLPHSRFVAADRLQSVDGDTVLVKTPGALCRCRVDEAGAMIQFPGGQVTGPTKIGPALQFIARSDRFAVRDLPGDLENGGKVTLARRFIREGLLMIAESIERGTEITKPIDEIEIDREELHSLS